MPREKKYTAKSFEAAATAYLDSIRRIKAITELVPTGELDKYGHPVLRAERVRDMQGKPMLRVEYVEPPTVGGLCKALGISRQTWAAYLSEGGALGAAAQAYREECQAWNERELLTREGKNLAGITFNLQANYGYGGQKQEIELGERATRAVAAPTLSLRERRELLEEIAADFAAGSMDGTDGDVGQG